MDNTKMQMLQQRACTKTNNAGIATREAIGSAARHVAFVVGTGAKSVWHFAKGLARGK